MSGSTNRNFLEFGMPISYRHPIPLPDVYWNSTATQGILVPDHWIPVLVGALSILQNEEVWEQADDSVRAEAINGATQLASSWERLVRFDGPPVDWEGSSSCTHGVLKNVITSNLWGTCSDEADSQKYQALYINDSIPIENMEYVHSYYFCGTLTPCEVMTKSFWIVPQFADDLVHIAVYDCSGLINTYDGVGTLTNYDFFGDSDPHAISSIDVISYTGFLEVGVWGTGLGTSCVA